MYLDDNYDKTPMTPTDSTHNKQIDENDDEQNKRDTESTQQ